MIWDEFLRHFRFCDEEDSGLSDEEQERKGPKNRPKHTRKRIHQAKKNFLEKFKTASTLLENLNRLLANPTEVKNAVVLRQPMKYISVSGCRYIQSRMQYIFNCGCSIYSFFRGIGCLRSSFYFYPFIIFRNSSSLRIGMLSARAFSSLLGPMFSPARMKLVFFEILPTFFPPCFSIISLYSSRE